MNSGSIGQFVLTDQTWSGNNFVYSFVKLYPHTNVAALEKKLPAFLDKYGEQQLKFKGMEKELHLQQVSSIHTSPGYEAEMSKTFSPVFLHLLLLIAGLVQLIACINFMNLSTARASKRAKEVGVRKVVGAGKRDLIWQFLSESFLLSLTSVLIALPLLFLLLPYFNDITQTNIHLSLFKDYSVWAGLAGLVLITTVVSGSYPAFYLSAFEVVKVLKGNLSNLYSVAGLRRSLVVFQFVISILLISAIIVIFGQMNFIKTRNLGFDKNQKLIFQFYTNDALKNTSAFMNDLRRLPEVKNVSRANNYPSQFVFNDRIFYLAGGNPASGLDIQSMLTDKYFVKTLGIRLADGRDFRQNDTGKVLINETCAKQLGLNSQTAPGTFLYFKDDV
ncbi:MAG: ABC transporter permease, partial [Chitinophagaceae bacterium]